MLAAQFSNNTRVGYVNLGDAVDLNNPTLCYDTMHLTPAGNNEIARHLIKPVVELMPDVFQISSRAERQRTSQ